MPEKCQAPQHYCSQRQTPLCFKVAFLGSMQWCECKSQRHCDQQDTIELWFQNGPPPDIGTCKMEGRIEGWMDEEWMNRWKNDERMNEWMEYFITIQVICNYRLVCPACWASLINLLWLHFWFYWVLVYESMYWRMNGWMGKKMDEWVEYVIDVMAKKHITKLI